MAQVVVFFFKFINILLWEQVGYILIYIFDETIKEYYI